MRVVLHGQPSLFPTQRLSSSDVHVRLSHLSRCRSLVFHTGRLWQTTTCADVVHRRCDTTKHRRHHTPTTKKKEKRKRKRKKWVFLCGFGARFQQGDVPGGQATKPEGSFFSKGGSSEWQGDGVQGRSLGHRHGLVGDGMGGNCTSSSIQSTIQASWELEKCTANASERNARPRKEN